MAWQSTVTAGGLALLQAWMAGSGTLSITGARSGSGAVNAAQMYAQTDVAGEKRDMAITLCVSEAASSGTALRVNAAVRMTTRVYVMRQVGLYGKIVNGATEVIGETLIALYQTTGEDGVNVPSSYNPMGFGYELSMALRMGTSETLALQLDPCAYVSENDLDDALGTLHPGQTRIEEMLYTMPMYFRYGIGEWQFPGTTWTAGSTGPGGISQQFTAPADRYACVIRGAVTERSMVMDSWIEVAEDAEPASTPAGTSGGTGDDEEEVIIDEEWAEIGSSSSGVTGNIKAPIEYETLDRWIMLTSAQMPTGNIKVGFIILK